MEWNLAPAGWVLMASLQMPWRKSRLAALLVRTIRAAGSAAYSRPVSLLLVVAWLFVALAFLRSHSGTIHCGYREGRSWREDNKSFRGQKNKDFLHHMTLSMA